MVHGGEAFSFAGGFGKRIESNGCAESDKSRGRVRDLSDLSEGLIGGGADFRVGGFSVAADRWACPRSVRELVACESISDGLVGQWVSTMIFLHRMCPRNVHTDVCLRG